MRRTIFISAMLICAFLTAAAPAVADTHNVSAGQSIQAAIDAASTGDTVAVAAGTYHQNIHLKSGIVVRGASASTTILHGNGTEPVVLASIVYLGARFERFTVTGGGRGGIEIANSPTTLVVADNIITGNTCTVGGGGIHTGGANPTIINNTISRNTGTTGGGIEVHGNWPDDPSACATITGNTVTENTATVGGGGIYLDNNSTITANTITGNKCPTSNGGGVCIENASPVLTNNVIAVNAGGCGSGVYFLGESPKLTNNTIANNVGAGGGVTGDIWSTPSIVNCVIWGNGIDDLVNCSATYSNISSQDDTLGAGNVSSNPMFLDATAGNYRLSQRSPAIDKGTNGGAPATDLEGTSRPRDGNNDAVATTDMGAYEAACTGATTLYVAATGSDTTGNGTVSKPFRSITRGLELAMPGDTVRVGAGGYGKSNSTETFPLVMKNGVTLQGNGCDDRYAANMSSIFGDGTHGLFYLHWIDQPTKIDGFHMSGGQDSLGGAMYIGQSSAVTISNNAIVRNTAQCPNTWEYSSGGAIFLYWADVTITANLIRSNTAANGSGGGIWMDRQAKARITNNVLAWNSATGSSDLLWPGHGGGIFMCSDASATIANNVIYQNSAASTGIPAGPGGGLFVADASTSHRITNNIFWGNTDDIGCTSNTTVTTSYCDVANGDPGTGNISTGPGFVGPEGSDWRLAPRSACIDRGTNTGAPATDRDGTARPIDGNGDSVSTVDIGAYEAGAYAGPVTIRAWTGGSDGDWNGTDLMPYRSITKAMSCALYGDTVLAGPKPPGTLDIYQAATGEVFPIVLGSGVKLQGMGASKSRIQGDGAHSVIYVPIDASTDTLLDGFNITGGGGGAGGGIDCNSTGNFTISNNVISGNAATEGGGIYCWLSSPKIVKNTIRNNSALTGAGLWIAAESYPTIANNFIYENAAAESGGGIYCFNGGYPTVVNSTLVGNTAPADGGGGVACVFPNMASISNSILWNNGADDLLSCSATYSDISSQDDTPGAGNISAAPSFVNTSTGDYRLSASSPCLEAGTNSGAPADDIDGVSRPQNGDNVGAGVTDMGAYERPYMAINDGQDVTTSTAVTVNSSFAGATEMSINNGTGWGAWQEYGPSKNITIPDGNGDKTVQVEYHYGSGRSMVLSDVITLDADPLHAPPRHTTSLVALAAPTAVAYNGRTEVTSTLTVLGAIVPNRVGVAVWGRPVTGGSWTQLAPASYDATGASYKAAANLTCNMLLQMRFAGDSHYKDSVSETLTVSAQALPLQPWLSASSPTHMTYFTVYGYLLPKHAGSTKLYFYRFTRLRRWVGHWQYYYEWRYVTARYATHSAYGSSLSRYRLVYRLAGAGRYYVRPYHADTSHSGTWGPLRTFTVR